MLPYAASVLAISRALVSASSAALQDPVDCLPASLAPLPRSPAPLCTPCVEGRQRAAPHSLFPPTTAPFQTLHLDKADRPTVLEPWLLAWGGAQGLCGLRLHSDRGGEFSSTHLETFCQSRGVIQPYTLPASPQQNGVAECRIGLVMEVARTSMCHAGAPQFLWPQAVNYAAHQLNLWPTADFRVWGCLAHVRAPGASKLSPCIRACVFLGFLLDASEWVFYDPVTCGFFASQGVTFDKSVCNYRSRPHRGTEVFSPPLFLTLEPPPVAPSSLPHRLVPVVSGGAGGAIAEGAVDVGVEVTPVEDTAASSRRPRPSSPPGFPVVPQFSPRSPLWPVTAELGGAPTGGTGGPGGVASGGASSGSVGAGGTGTVAPTPCTVRFLARGNSTTSTGSLDITPDDILVYSKNMKEHVEQLRKVFEILRKNKFYVKLSKSDFALKKVQFLGHMVSAEGVHVDPRKIEAVKKWKVPENVKELQQFIGFAKYYNRFVPQYAKIAAPLTDLLKKDTPFKWDTPHQQAMEQLQTALTTAPVLILPDPEKDYVVEADASDQAVGAVLMQDHGRGLQPIAYLSKKLHGAELNYPIHDKEALAIVVAFKAWRDFYTWSFELELLQQNAQIYHYFDGSYAGPSEETDDAKNKYYNESLMAYGVLLRNMSLTEQLSIRSYKTSPAPALNAWRHLNGAYQPKDSVSSSRLLQQLLETKMAPGEKANSYLNRCRSLRDQIAKLGSTISEEIFMNIVLQGLGPEWRLCKVLLQQQRVISEAALYAALLIEQRDMDQQQPAPHRDKEHLAFYADSTEERQPQRLCCKICRNFGHLADRCKHRSRPHQTNPSNWSGQQDARNDTLPAQGHQPPSRSLNLTVQRQQQPSQAAPVRSVMGNMIMTSGSRRPRARSPSPEPAPDPIGAFSNNNPFSTRQDYSDDDKQDWNLPVSLLESPPHVPNIRPAPINWIARKQFLKVDTPYIVTPRLALLARNDNRRYNTWYLDSCWGQHMVGSERYISNVVATPAVTYVTVANNTRLRASAQGIVVLKAHGSRTHITLNDVLIVQNLCLNLLSAALLLDCRVILSTDPETCDILLHFTMPNKMHKQIGWAHAENGVYVLNFDIPDCSGDSQELIDLVPLCFEHIHRRDWKHPDGHPWVPHHPHPRELALHDPDPDGVCSDWHTPTSSSSAIAGRGLPAIIKAGNWIWKQLRGLCLAYRKILSPDPHPSTSKECFAASLSAPSTHMATHGLTARERRQKYTLTGAIRS
ncbi:unnamed protein product [Closterium sp. NIES-54]